MGNFEKMNEILTPAKTPRDFYPLTQNAWRPLYHAINKMLMDLGADGEITTENKHSMDVMNALSEIDGGVYDESF